MECIIMTHNESFTMNIPNIVTATVETVDVQNNLIIRLAESGDRAMIPAKEIGRRPRDAYYYLGKKLEVLPMNEAFGGLAMYSAKMVEEVVFETIRIAFERHERNVYIAELKGIDNTKRAAVYEIGAGVCGVLYSNALSLTNFSSYEKIILPPVMPVAITSIKKDRIYLSAIPFFGSFKENINRLNIEPGHVVTGRAIQQISSGIMVCLSPNVSTVINFAPLGKSVRVRIREVDYSRNLVKAIYEETLNEKTYAMDLTPFVHEPESVNMFVDVAAFAEANRYIKKDTQRNDVLDSTPTPSPSFIIESVESPFRYVEGETIKMDTSLPHAALDRGTSSGHLTEEHAELARVVDTLKFATKAHIERYLYLTGHTYSQNQLESMLQTLVIHHVLLRFHYSENGLDDHKFVYCRSNNYIRFAKTYMSYFKTTPIEGESSCRSKGRLAVNQLLIGILKNEGNVRIDRMVRFPDDHWRNSLNCAYRVQTNRYGSCVLDSCRTDYDSYMLKQLQHYDTYQQNTNDNFNVIITLEDESHMLRFAEQIEQLKLSYRVMLTHDLRCYEPQFLMEILPAKQSLMDKLRGIGDLLIGKAS